MTALHKGVDGPEAPAATVRRAQSMGGFSCISCLSCGGDRRPRSSSHRWRCSSPLGGAGYARDLHPVRERRHGAAGTVRSRSARCIPIRCRTRTSCRAATDPPDRHNQVHARSAEAGARVARSPRSTRRRRELRCDAPGRGRHDEQHRDGPDDGERTGQISSVALPSGSAYSLPASVPPTAFRQPDRDGQSTGAVQHVSARAR